MVESNKKSVIALSAGGTGGHMFPASALAHELIARGYDILLLTDKRGMAYAHIFEGCSVICVESHSPMQGGLAKRISAIWCLLGGSFSALKTIRQHGVVGVVGFGGYASLPAVLAARLLLKPYGLHEQNAVIGRVNRLLLGGARFLATTFEGTKRVKDSALAKTVVTGNPTREGIAIIGNDEYKLPAAGEMFNILAVGGSQGARIFADIIPAALTFLDSGFKSRLVVNQQCRGEDQQRVEKAYKRSGISCQTHEFIDDMAAALKRAHLVISRAGAGSVTEVALASRPAIFVPLAIAADNHQTHNARALSENRAGWLLPENEFSPGPLAALIGGLLTASDQLQEAAKNARELAKPRATKNLADLVEEKLLQKTIKEIKPNTENQKNNEGNKDNMTMQKQLGVPA